MYVKCPEQANPQIQKVNQWLPGTDGRGEWGMSATGYGVSFQGDKNALEIILAMAAQLCKYTKTTELYTSKG